MWLQVELPEPTMLTEIAFESAVAAVQQGPAVRGAPTRSAVRRGSRAVPGFPRGYRVQVSTDGTTWGSPVAEGQGTGAQTRIAFIPTRAKFVRITQTATVERRPPTRPFAACGSSFRGHSKGTVNLECPRGHSRLTVPASPLPRVRRKCE